MLSSIIYETFDLVYTLGRLAKRVVIGTYSFIYNKKTGEQERLRILEKRIIELEEQHGRVEIVRF